ncbi:MAG: Methionyl-tRNA formyltransferase, partial [uncultured bacterium]
MKIIFFGSSRFVIPLIEMLKQQFELVLVVTTESNTSDAVPAYCLEHNIKYLSISSFTDDVKSQLLTVNCEMAALAYFGLILPKDVLNIFPKGIINVHPSLLPLYRGPTPGQAALLSGDKETGITIIKLDEEVDHGPVL